jgi:hypothetical protein
MQLASAPRAARPVLHDSEVSCTPAEHISEDQPGTEEYRYLVDTELGAVERALGESLPIPVYLSLGVAKEGSETLAWASPQSTHCTQDPATSCQVQLLYNRIDGRGEDDVRATIAHELVHCFQARWLPPYQSLTSPPWLAEGFADFVGQDLHPGGERVNFALYTKTPFAGLFGRTYDAQGFYFHLKTIGDPPTGRFKEAYRAGGNMEAFRILTDPSGEDFADTWGSVLAFETGLGRNWYMPEAPPGSTRQYLDTTLKNGKRVRLDAPPASNYVEHVEFAAEVVKINVKTGSHGRVSWDGRRRGRAHRRVARRAVQGEVGDEIQGRPVRGRPVGDERLHDPGTGRARPRWGRRLRRRDRGDQRRSDRLELRRHVAGHRDRRADRCDDLDVRRRQDRRVPRGVRRQVGRHDRLRRCERVDGGQHHGPQQVEGGPGLYAGAVDGGYTCSGDTFSYSTVDPVESKTVSVLFHKE